MSKIKIVFVTCTVREAVDEVNIMLKEARSKCRVTEHDIIDTVKTKHEKDWFDDYAFYFVLEVPSYELDKLKEVGLDYKVIS